MTNQQDNDLDLDNNGVIDEKEFRLIERRLSNQRRMAWLALAGIFAIVGFVLIGAGVGLISIPVTEAVGVVAGTGIIALSGIIAAYFGVEAWMTKRN